MPNDLLKEVEHHIAVYPDHRSDVIEMQKEWSEYKTKAFWVLLGFSGSILAIGVWVGTIQTNIENVNEDHIKRELQFEQIERRIGALEVTNGEIRARLTSIDLILQEIKLSIQKLK